MRISESLLLILLLGCASAFPLDAAEKVVPYQRYRAEFEIRAAEKVYPLDWFCIGVNVKYPNAELVFQNAKGKAVHQFRVMRFHAFSDSFAPGAIEFYVPEGAAKVVLRKNGVELRNFRVVPVPAGENLALPADYRISGQFTKNEITPGKDGSGIFDCTTGGISFYPVPVEPGAKYRLTVNGAKGDKSSGLVIRTSFYRNGNSEKSQVAGNKEPMRIGGKKKSFTTTFRVPENARWFRLFCMWGIVYDYRLEKIQ